MLFRRRAAQTGRVGLYLGAGFGALVHVTATTGARPVVRLADSFLPDSADTEGRLAALVRQHRLERCPCVGLMAPGSYSLLQIEPPAVPPEELREAVRWQIKDFLDFPLSDAVVDLFPVPDRPRQKRLIYAVAARNAHLAPLTGLAKRLQLSCSTIDIPELALRNLLHRLEGDDGGLACLYLGRTQGLVIVLREKMVYLARHINLGCEQLAGSGDGSLLEALALELQRSLDYYESSVSRLPVRRLLVCPTELPVAALVETLDRQLAPAVSWLNPHELLELDGSLEGADLARCLLPIGAALREVGA